MKKILTIVAILMAYSFAAVTIAETNNVQYRWIVGTNLFAGYASNTDGSLVTNYYKTNDGSFVVINTNASSWTLDYNTHLVGDGTNVWTFMTVSADESLTNTYALTNRVDNSAPGCVVTNVAANGYVKGTYTFMATNYEPTSLVNFASCFISNNSDVVWTNTATVAGDWVYFATNTANFADGIYHVYFVVTNSTLLSGASDIVRFHMINDLPPVACTNFTHLSTNSGTNYYAGYASNVFPTIDPVSLYFQTNSGTLGEITVASGLWTTNFNSHPLVDGTNTYTVYAVTSNSITNSYTWTNIVNNRATSIAITNLTNNQQLTSLYFTFRGTNYDPWPAPAVTRLVISNHYGEIVTNASIGVTNYLFAYTLYIYGWPAGEYYIYAVTTNTLGTEAKTATINFDLPVNAPSVVTTGAYPFQMGSTRNDDEQTVHSVYLSALSMGTKEVSYLEYNDVVYWATNNGYSFTSTGQAGGERNYSAANHTNTEPVTLCTWYDALKYCNALSEMQGLTPCYYTNGISASHVLRTGTPTISNSYVLFTNTASTTNGWRLPTEAEWEQAYYYTRTTTYHWGNGDPGNYAIWRKNSGLETAVCGSKLSNDYAIFDMSGNVWEWVHDWYGSSYTNVPQINPRGNTTGTYRVIRGGSFKDREGTLTGTKRYYFTPTDGRYFIGFRVCKTQ